MCSSTSQNINQTKALNLQWAPQKDVQDQVDEPIIAADTKRKAQMQNLSGPRLRDSSFYTLSGPLCRAKALEIKYWKKQKPPRLFWKTISDHWSPGSDELEPLQKLFSGYFWPNLKNKTYKTTSDISS